MTVGLILSGLSAFPITPMDGRGRIDPAALERLVARVAGGGARSIGLLGSTGSQAYLPRAARAEAVAAAVGAARGLPVAVGVGAPALAEVLENIADAAEAGASAALLAPVTYQPLREEEVFALHRLVSDEAALPVILYNNPRTTKVTFSPALIARIGALPGVVAVKMPPRPNPAEEIAGLRAALPQTVALGYSGDARITGALRAGVDLWFSVLGGLFPEICAAMMSAARAGAEADLAALDARLAPLWRVFDASGSYRVMHAAAEMAGYGPTAPPLPVLALEGEERAAVAAALKQAELLV